VRPKTSPLRRNDGGKIERVLDIGRQRRVANDVDGGLEKCFRRRRMHVVRREPGGDAVERADERIGTAASHAEAQTALGARRRHERLGKAEEAAVHCLIDPGAGEIIEGTIGGLNDMAGDEGRTLGGTLLAAPDAALPFQHRPAGKIVLRQLGEDG